MSERLKLGFVPLNETEAKWKVALDRMLEDLRG